MLNDTLMVVTPRVLSEFYLFSGLDDDALHEIARYVHIRTFEPEQVITFEGEPCQAVYLVVRGVVRTHRSSLEGREHVLDYLGPGECFNLAPVLDGGSTLATVDALTQATLCTIPCDRFRQIVQDHQAVAMAVLKHLAGQVRHLSGVVEDLALHTVRTRLARFLLSNANSMSSARRWTQEEIATHIGTVRDVVGRTLRAFAKEGLVRQGRGRLVVADRARLEREAMYA